MALVLDACVINNDRDMVTSLVSLLAAYPAGL